MDPTSPMTISNLLVHIPSRVASIDASMLPLTGDLRSGARADLRIQGTPHLLHLRMCTHASSCTPQCHLHPHHHLTLRHTSAPQLSHRCPRISQHSVDRNEQVFKPTGPHCLSCLSSSRGVWACTTSTSGEISHIYASCSSTRPMKRRPKRTDKARHTSAPQLSHRCPRISQHSVDRNERASLQADWASLSLVHVLFSWRVGLYDFDFWGDLAYASC